MAKKVGLITINLLAGTAEFNANMDSAKAKIRSLTSDVDAASHKLVTGNQAASGFIRVAENGMANNLRAVENFMTRTLGLGPAMQAIFPVVGAIAFGGLIVSLGEKVYSFFKKTEEGATRVANAFRELTGPIQLSNDELRVSNDRLALDIAKLEGKRQNNLQLALDEARVAADKLADSLERDLKELNKILKEENISAFKGFFINAQSTSGLRDYMKQFTADEGDITDAGQTKIKAAAEKKDPKAQDAAITELNTALENKYAEAIKHVAKELSDARLRQIEYKREMETRRTGKGDLGSGVADQSTEIEMLRASLEILRAGPEHIDLTQKGIDLKKKKDTDEANNANSRLERPFDNKMAALTADLQQAAEKLSAVHMSEDMKALAVANGDAVKSIEQVNKALKALHEGPMSQANEDKIKAVETGIVLVREEADWQTKIVASTAAIKDRIVSQRMLTAAVGQGYEATKKAAVEYEVMKAVGFEKFNDPKFMADPAHKPEIDQYRSDAQADYEEKHATQVAQSIKSLGDHIALEQKLATVQIQGAEAVRVATLALEIQNIRRDESVDVANRMVKAKTDEYNAERGNVASTQLAVILHEIDATRRLTAAQVQGAEAARRAGLETKYQGMQREGAPPENIAATRKEDELQHQAKITEEVLKTANADRDRLADLDQEEVKAKALVGTAADQLGIMVKLREIENERLTIEAKQLLEIGTLNDGFKAFFVDMNKEAEKPGKILFDGMNSAVNGLSDQLTKVMTGQKTAWASMFKSVGDDMLKATLKTGMQHGLAAFGNSSLGKKLGLGGLGAGKPDGTKLNPWHVVNDAAGTLAPGGIAGKALGALGLGTGKRDGQTPATAFYVVSVSEGGTGTGGAGLGGLAGLFGGVGAAAAAGGGGVGLEEAVTSSISYMAGGGDVSADKAYVVGDEGPEILRKTSGTIMSNSASKKLMSEAGGNHFYTIDARGTDPALTEQRTRQAILAAHNSAIGKAVQVQQEQVKRNPQR